MRKVFGLFALLLVVNLGFIACEPNSTSDAGDDNVFENVTGTGDEEGEVVDEDTSTSSATN
ncbi:hypothetical protein KORDIASMS9_03574 [Kordia sp. SMS9]|uniref:hypothetical protein n=1 Tax=Kordia sp. SMS9 TaxID=2282170 RepID=UPI000E0CE5B8|nr:hypothetical protein [Kordia sp. SMS9]AXG71317.1 hypothetical protein KORDIASMS9_03574 [Kordia sp. SMS9]